MKNEIALTDQGFAQIEKAGAYIAKSGLFGVKNPEQAIALMLVAASEGRNPMEAARDYHIIQGRPALKADALLARFQLAGGKVEWKEINDAKVSATFSHPQGGSATIDWDMKRAERAKLSGKDNWIAYPRQMLRARVISEGVRTVYPAVCIGMYALEEAQDMADVEPSEKLAEDMEIVIKEETAEEKARRIIAERDIPPEEKSRLWHDSGKDWNELLKKLESPAGQPEIF